MLEACHERTFDVVVVGGGPAGLAAAARAGEAGCSVALVDDNPALGGQIWRADRGRLSPSVRRSMDRLEASGVLMLGGTTLLGKSPPAPLFQRGEQDPSGLWQGNVASVPNWDGDFQPEARRAFTPPFEKGGRGGIPPNFLLNTESNGQPLRLHTSRVILATGARERFLPFPGWTLPGVYGVGGLQALVKGGWDVHGQRLMVAGSGPLLLAVASSLRQRGAEIVGIVEQSPFGSLVRLGASLMARPGKLAQLARLEFSLRGVPRHYSTWPTRVLGEQQVEAVVLHSASSERQASEPKIIECDGLACGFGLVPDTRLASLFGCTLQDGSLQDGTLQDGCVAVDELQATSVPGVFCAGESTGIGGVDLATVEGEIAGLAAADRSDEASALFARRRREQRFAAALESAFALRDELRSLPDDDTIVCRCEDATWSQVRDAIDSRDAKLQSRCGMGPCQGRVCGPALEFLCGFQASAPRPPLFPVPLGLWAELSKKPDC